MAMTWGDAGGRVRRGIGGRGASRSATPVRNTLRSAARPMMCRYCCVWDNGRMGWRGGGGYGGSGRVCVGRGRVWGGDGRGQTDWESEEESRPRAATAT
eukprot:2566235-Rhodomonas_salina.2